MSAFRSSSLIPRGAFADQQGTAPRDTMSLETRGVIVSPRDELAVATVLVRRGQNVALADQVRAQLLIELPQGSQRTTAGDLSIAGIGRGMWLATHERADDAFAPSLKQAVGGLASISDHTDGYAVLHLSGHRVRDTLSKLVPIDVHPRAFKVGDVAVTVAGHIGATLWRLDDRGDGLPAFEVALNRSYAASFWYALHISAAEFGLIVAESLN